MAAELTDGGYIGSHPFLFMMDVRRSKLIKGNRWGRCGTHCDIDGFGGHALMRREHGNEDSLGRRLSAGREEKGRPPPFCRRRHHAPPPPPPPPTPSSTLPHLSSLLSPMCNPKLWQYVGNRDEDLGSSGDGRSEELESRGDGLNEELVARVAMVWSLGEGTRRWSCGLGRKRKRR